jgi:hypothetical protein
MFTEILQAIFNEFSQIITIMFNEVMQVADADLQRTKKKPLNEITHLTAPE